MSATSAVHWSKSPHCSVFFFFVILIIAVLVSPGVTKKKWKKRCSISSRCEVLRVYGDMFKTEEEQAELQKKYFSNPENIQDAEMKDRGDPDYYLQICPNSTFGDSSGSHVVKKRKKRSFVSGQVHYHACCESQGHFISPNSAISDHNGQQVELVQFPNEKQYFLDETCRHDQSCSLNCRCQKQEGLHRALVDNNNYNWNNNQPRFQVKTVRLGGCCKCMNNM